MPRPKGSKNKAKTPVVIIDYAAELEKKISEKNTLEADITALEADVDARVSARHRASSRASCAD